MRPENNYIVVPTDERSQRVLGAFTNFQEIARKHAEAYPPSEDLRQTYSEISQVGIWKKINQMNPRHNQINSDVPMVFTGQQPTLDWGIYRRFGKRSGVHSGVLTIHHHADHDHAGKDGFGEVKLPSLMLMVLLIKRTN